MTTKKFCLNCVNVFVFGLCCKPTPSVETLNFMPDLFCIVVVHYANVVLLLYKYFILLLNEYWDI